MAEASGLERARLARDAYTYFHLPMIAGIVLFAFGLETTLEHVDRSLDTLPGVALCGGAALYLLGQVAFLVRSMGRPLQATDACSTPALVPTPAALAVPALAALALVSAVCVLVVAYEAVARREHRLRLRYPGRS